MMPPSLLLQEGAKHDWFALPMNAGYHGGDRTTARRGEAEDVRQRPLEDRSFGIRLTNRHYCDVELDTGCQ